MLARSNEELQRFAYVASHDLQEPLRKIISFSGLLMERMPDSLDADTQMYVDRIVGSAARMQRLIEDLLLFSRTGGAVELRPANRTPIEQLLQNLIGNALKYRSETAPRIHVGAEELDGAWRRTISDNGIGIGIGIGMVYAECVPAGQFPGTRALMTESAGKGLDRPGRQNRDTEDANGRTAGGGRWGGAAVPVAGWRGVATSRAGRGGSGRRWGCCPPPRARDGQRAPQSSLIRA